MPLTEQQIREQHPDWSDEQVQTELAKQSPAPEPTPEPTPTPKEDAAFARMRRENEQLQAQLLQERKAREERERKEAEEQGRWQQLAEQEKAKREEVEARERSAEARRLAERTATDLKFRDPGYALYLLEQDGVDLSGDGVKSALEGLAKSRTDLIGSGTPPPSGGPAGGADPTPPRLTRDQLTAMSDKQIAALDPQVLNEALAS